MNLNDRWLIVLLPVLTFILYANSISGEFLFDDTFLVRDNPFIENFSNFSSYFTSGTETFGRPVRLLSFYLDTALFGKSTTGYHISNIFYYTIFCILAYYFCQLCFKNKILSIFTTLIFIAHPLHTEGVAYISGRKDILGGLFSFATLICFLKFLKNKKRTYSLLTVLFFLLAINTKEIYAILPILFFAIGWYQDEKIKNHKYLLGGFFIVAFLFLLYIIFFRNRIFFDYLHVIPVYGNNQGINLPTAIKISAYILYLAFLPFSLSADYTYNAVKRINFSDPHFFISVSILVIFGCTAYLLRHRQKEISFGLLWMLICLLPVSQLVPYPEVISERSIIVLSFGACLIVGGFLIMLNKKYAVGLLCAILLIFSFTTIKQNRVWHDDLSLWSASVKQEPDCARAHYNLGCALAKHNQLSAAGKEFLASLAINPPELITVPDYSFDALVNLGNVYALLKKFPQAKAAYQKVLHCVPTNQSAQKNFKTVQLMEKNQAGKNQTDPSSAKP
jgi:tetratricopeptide (TPR) repeat protein